MSVDNLSMCNLICCKPCQQNHRKFQRSPNHCWNFQSDYITRITTERYCSKVDTGSDINCISLGTFQRLFPNKQLNMSTLLLETMEIHQCLSLESSQHSSNGKERCSVKNFMLLMLILHLIYFTEMLVSELKCYRCVSCLQIRSAKWKKYLLLQNHIGNQKKLCIPLIQKV